MSWSQITAEQLLRESQALQEQDFKPPTQKITDPTELAEYRLRKRKEYEDLVRRVRWNVSVWVKVSSPSLFQLEIGVKNLFCSTCYGFESHRPFSNDCQNHPNDPRTHKQTNLGSCTTS